MAYVLVGMVVGLNNLPQSITIRDLSPPLPPDLLLNTSALRTYSRMDCILHIWAHPIKYNHFKGIQGHLVLGSI